MKSKSLFLSLGLTLLTLTGSPALAANVHGLTAAQIQKVRAIGVKLVVPGYLPAGFKLVSFEARTGTRIEDDWPMYTLVYRGPGKREFSLCGGQTCSWGADNTGAARIKAANPLFKQLTLFRFKNNQILSYSTAHEMVLKSGDSFDFSSPGYDADTTGMKALPESESLKILSRLKLL